MCTTTTSVRRLQALQGTQVRRAIGRLFQALAETRLAIDALERQAGNPDEAVEADRGADALCVLTWGSFSRELAFLDTACLHAASCLECDFTGAVNAVTGGLARRRA